MPLCFASQLLSAAVTLALAIDVGGTKLACGLIDERGELLVREVAPTLQTTDSEALFGVLASLVERVLASPTRGAADVSVCGVGCAGPMTRGGELVSPLNIAAWHDFPLRERLEQLVGVPVFIDNDAKALALGEGWVGAAANETDFVAMVVSTGIGGGIVLNGRLLDGSTGNAGHIGHMIVEPEGRTCGCGAQGCLEAEAAGPAIEAKTGRPPSEAVPEMIEHTGRLIGRAVASVATLLDLRLAVVAGSVAFGFGAPFFEAAQAELDMRARLSFSSGAQIRPAGLAGNGPIIGAAAVGWRGLGRVTRIN